MNINISSLAHPAMQCKLAGAMRRAIANSKSGFMARYGTGHHTVRNKNGKAFIVVAYQRAVLSTPSGFKFYCPYTGDNVTPVVLASLRK